MQDPVRVAARSAVVVLASGLALGLLAGCSGGRDDDGDRPAPGGSRAAGASAEPSVATVTTVSRVSGRLGDARRRQTKTAIDRAIDTWIDGAYLGSFPRTDFAPAFTGFTRQAAALAQRQLDVMSNQAISDRVSTVTATNRRVRLTLLAPDGEPRGATARIVLDLHTQGELSEDLRVLGQLYLTKQAGSPWRIFGFRVDQPVTR